MIEISRPRQEPYCRVAVLHATCVVPIGSGTRKARRNLMPARNKSQDRYVIVVGIDFSDASAEALQEAVRLTASTNEAELHLVHVVQVSTPSPTIAGPVSHEEGVDTWTTWTRCSSASLVLAVS